MLQGRGATRPRGSELSRTAHFAPIAVVRVSLIWALPDGEPTILVALLAGRLCDDFDRSWCRDGTREVRS